MQTDADRRGAARDSHRLVSRRRFIFGVFADGRHRGPRIWLEREPGIFERAI